MKKLSIKQLLLLFVLSFLMMGMAVNAKSEETINRGIFIETIDVSGMTKEEARQAVEEYMAELDAVEITLNAIDDNKVVATAGELGLTWNNKEILQEALDLGKKGNIIRRYKVKKDLEKQNKVFHITVSADTDVLFGLLTEKCEKFNKEAKNASLLRENGVFSVKEGQTGTVIAVEKSVEAINYYFSDQWNHEPAVIDLVIETEEPKGKKEELLKVKDLLGSSTTSFRTSGSSRVRNVNNGTNLINATTLYPGETFSTYEAVNPFTEENGYYMAGSYLNGMVVDSLGGGICQVSTTLYGAVLAAELEVTERFNHSMIVTYVEPSADAAIAGTYKDFKFTNNTDAPIYIEGYTTEDKKIYFNIFGMETRSENRKVTYVSEVLTTTPPEPERIIADVSQPVGFIDVQSAHTGYTAKLWKVVEEDGVEVSRTEVNKSTYKQTPRTATVGMGTPDPGIMAAMQEAVATGSIDHVRNVVGAFKAAQAQAIAAAQAQPPTQPEQPAQPEQPPVQPPIP